MKELTIEEKAKRFDEAFETAKNIRFGNPNSATANVVCEDIFPELKEINGEKIRKEIADFIRWDIDRGSITKEQREKTNSWLAWLEKQDPQAIKEALRTEYEKGRADAIAERWKPSELEIHLLEMIADGKSNPQDFQALLGGLIGQLKKLKGE